MTIKTWKVISACILALATEGYIFIWIAKHAAQ